MRSLLSSFKLIRSGMRTVISTMPRLRAWVRSREIWEREMLSDAAICSWVRPSV